jgi:Permuted papain-like amidase enzyme, YaeF/YiiX, C92 family
MNIRASLLEISIPIGKAIAKVHRPECIINSKNYLDMEEKLRDGDVLMSRTDWEVSNSFIPGAMKHAAIYVKGFVYESTTKGVRKITLAEFVFKKDEVRACRPISPILSLDEGIKFLEDQMNEPYDYGFMWQGSSSWYCSKYVYYFYCHAIPGFEKLFELREVFGEPTIKPIDYWLAIRVFERVYTSQGDL